MTLNELDAYFNSFLKKEDCAGDISLNGIQIQNSAPDSMEIKKVAFAVDACEATALKAKEIGADVLFVHHGLFWGGCQTITDSFYKRVAPFIKNDIALIAYHAPLDINKPYGNNFGLANRIGLTKVERFGTWRGMLMGVYGQLKKAMSLDELSAKIMAGQKPLYILPFGKEQIKTVGIISGGGGDNYDQAVALGLDAYITGEVDHALYHSIKEAGINVIAGGHYQTETVGVKLVMEKLKKEKKLEVEFIDFPTGM